MATFTFCFAGTFHHHYHSEAVFHCSEASIKGEIFKISRDSVSRKAKIFKISRDCKSFFVLITVLKRRHDVTESDSSY